MFKSMREETLKRIVGPGIVDFYLEWLPDSKDHERRNAGLKHNWGIPDSAPCPVWDFVAIRGDGSLVRLHTNQTNRKVSIAEMPG